MSRRPQRRWLRAALAALAGLALADLIVSTALLPDGRLGDRPLPPYGVVFSPRQERWIADQRTLLEGGTAAAGTCLVFDPLLGWSPSAGAVDPDDGVPINSAGCRGPREYDRARPRGVLRIECFGESFTWCSVVRHGDSWPLLLERARPDREVLNFGVPGFGTDQALLRLRRDGTGWGAQVMLMGLMLENIGRNVNRYRPRWYPPSFNCVAKPRFVLTGAGQLELVASPFATHRALIEAVASGRAPELLAEHEYWLESGPGILRRSSLVRLAEAYVDLRRRSVPALWLDPGGEPYRVTLALLEAFASEAREDGAAVAAVVIFPRDTDLADWLERDRPYWSAMRADLRARGLEVVDTSEALFDAARERGLAPLYGGGHLSAEGNAIVAAVLEDWLAPLAASGRLEH